jgi:hypothetical protein
MATPDNYNAPAFWNGKALEGLYEVTMKIDGVRMLRDKEGNPVSRSNKPLLNLDLIPEDITDAEIYLGSVEKSVSAVRTHDGALVEPECAYRLFPADPRLFKGYVLNPDPAWIQTRMEKAVAEGYEGLVLVHVNTGKSIKHKPEENFDVIVLDMIEGKGKRKGCVGKIVTEMGNVGIFKGFKQADLKDLWDRRDEIIGQKIEVACMQLTPAGKFRHGKLIRERWDK